MKRFSPVLVLLCLMSVVPQAHALPDAQKTFSYAAAVLLALSVLKFNCTEATNDPVRYNIEELKAGTDVLNNLYYLMIDGLIGHAGKKSYMKADATGKIEFSNKVDPKGLYGYIHAYFDSVEKTVRCAAVLAGIKIMLAEGFDNWQALADCNFEAITPLPKK